MARPLLRTLSDIRTMTSHTRPPIRLVSVNTVPDRAQKVIGAVIDNVKDKYDIVHVGNSATIKGVKSLLESTQPPPDILFCASMWTPEEQEEIQKIAKQTIPGIKTNGTPTGLHTQVGPDGIVRYLVERIDDILAEK